MKAVRFELSTDLRQELVVLDSGAPDLEDVIGRSADHPLIAEMSAVPADHWFAIANWAKQTSNLQPWQRRMAYSIGTYTNRGRLLSIKQSVQADR